MKIGMLWFDNDPKKTLATKITEALQYYREKYAREPNLVYVHPSTKDIKTVSFVEILTSRSVLPNHFWIGVRDVS